MRIVLVLIAFLAIAGAEQSVYSDSDFVDSDMIAKKNSREIFLLKQKVSQLKEQIEGLKSIIEGQATEIERLKSKDNSGLIEAVNQLSKRVSKLESRPAQVVVKEQPSAERLPKEESKTVKTKSASKEKEIPEQKPKSSSELYKEAVLNITKNRLTKAKSQFEKLLSRGYKKASVNFYLGEIAYKKGRYKEAISHYQASASLNENASYMDKLLLHTAIALKKKGKSEDAKVFFKAVIDGYPGSKSAKEAKKYLGE